MTLPGRAPGVRAMSRRVLAILALLLVSAGCAGRDFKRPALESLAVGTATEAEMKVYRQILVVQYDGTGVVKEIEYSATGER